MFTASIKDKPDFSMYKRFIWIGTIIIFTDPKNTMLYAVDSLVPLQFALYLVTFFCDAVLGNSYIPCCTLWILLDPSAVQRVFVSPKIPSIHLSIHITNTWAP
jgi:hypothetical protein